jgi:hypothetical protein
MTSALTPLPVCAMLIAVALFCIPVSAQVSSVIIESYQVTPAVLMPGEMGTVTVTIRSVSSGTQTSTVSYPDSGFTASSATTSEIIPYVDSVILTEEDIKVLGGNGQFEGYVGPNQIIPLTFLIEAPQKSGLYFPEVWIRVRGGQSVKYPVPVNVNTQLSVMRVPSISLYREFPAMVRPGETAEGAIIISNGGQVRADNIQLLLATEGLPVAPAGPSVFLIEYLDPGERAGVNVSLTVDQGAESLLTEIPVQVSYRLLDGSLATRNEAISLDIRGEAELGIAALETSPIRVVQGQPFDLTIRIENTGTGDAKSVSATVDLPFTGTKEAFIGKIKPGNDAPAVFTLDAGRPGTYQYLAEITFTDDWGTRTFTRQLDLVVYRSYGTWIALVALIILAVGGYFGYRWWKAKHGAS